MAINDIKYSKDFAGIHSLKNVKKNLCQNATGKRFNFYLFNYCDRVMTKELSTVQFSQSTKSDEPVSHESST